MPVCILGSWSQTFYWSRPHSFPLFLNFVPGLYSVLQYLHQLPVLLPSPGRQSRSLMACTSYRKEEDIEPVKSNGFLTVSDVVFRNVRSNKEFCVVSPPPLLLTKEGLLCLVYTSEPKPRKFCIKYQSSSWDCLLCLYGRV